MPTLSRSPLFRSHFLTALAILTVAPFATAARGQAAPPAATKPAAAAIVPTAKTDLFNGKDLAGWRVWVDNATEETAKDWKVTDGVLHLDTKTKGYVQTEKFYANYHLHVEWRFAADATGTPNSGVLVHMSGPDAIWPLCFECQLAAGNAGQIVGTGLDIPDAPMQQNRKRAPKLAASSEKPFGQWNTYEIFCRDNTIEVFVNDVRQNKVDKLPAKEGKIGLQMEGFSIDFRNIWVAPLDEKK